jgi:hypothetical protein
MPFNWSEFYRLATQLGTQLADEAALRSAVSRAYYATYHLADERRSANNLSLPPIPNAGMHLRLWYLFRNHPHASCRKIGIDGDRLRKRRARADYEPVIPNLPSELILAMQEAQSLIRSIASLPPILP